MGMTFLARACTKAFSSGSSSSDGRASLSQHFPGCCLLRWDGHASIVSRHKQWAAGWQGSQEMYQIRCCRAWIHCHHGSAAASSPLAGLGGQDVIRDACRAHLACMREQDPGEQQLSWVVML